MTKCERSLLQNMSGFLLQNAAILLQNIGIIRKYDQFITRRESCWKIRRLLQNASVCNSY